MRRLRIGAVVIGLLAAATPAQAGWVIDQVTRGVGDGSHTQRVLIQANRLKMVNLEGGRTTQATVMDLDAQTLTHIDYTARSYTAGTAKEYAEAMSEGLRVAGEAMDKMQESMKEMEETIKQMPPEQRRQMEAILREAQQSARQQAAQPRGKPEDCAPDKVDIKRTGQRDTIAGYDASGYQVFANGKLETEVWIAPAITAVRELDLQKLERMVSDMLKGLPQCPPRGAMFGADPVWKLMKDGYPVRTVDKSGGAVTEVVKAESRSLGAGEFRPPAGFARKTLREMMGGK